MDGSRDPTNPGARQQASLEDEENDLSRVRNSMPDAYGPIPDVRDYEARRALLARREASLAEDVRAAIDAEIERLHHRPAAELRRDPAMSAEIERREQLARDFLLAEIEQERRLIALYLY